MKRRWCAIRTIPTERARAFVLGVDADLENDSGVQGPGEDWIVGFGELERVAAAREMKQSYENLFKTGYGRKPIFRVLCKNPKFTDDLECDDVGGLSDASAF
jgi:hypothetical protein